MVGGEDSDVPEDRADPVLDKRTSTVMDTLTKIGSFTQVFQRFKDRRLRDRDPDVFGDEDLVAPRDDDSLTNRRLI